jgi:hypothetical protein
MKNQPKNSTEVHNTPNKIKVEQFIEANQKDLT